MKTQLVVGLAILVAGQCAGADKKTQTITFDDPSNQLMSVAPLPLRASADSKLPVKLRSLTEETCTLDGTLLKMVAAGPCVVIATREGTADFEAAEPVIHRIVLSLNPQAITFANPGDATVGAPLQLVASADSKLKVTFSAVPTSVCGMVTDQILTPVASGPCTITASQPGKPNPNYAAAQSVSQQIEVKGQFPGVDLVLGIGSLLTANRTSYELNTTGSANRLQGGQIGRATPQLLAGTQFQLPFGKFFFHKDSCSGKTDKWDSSCRPWAAFVSLKFSTGTAEALTGYTFGVSYRLQKYLAVLVGYTLTEFKEPSPGFRAAAVAVVANNPTLYPTFNAAGMNNNVAGAFDGFPTQCIATAKCGGSASATTGTTIYGGTLLEPHYRGGAMIGISVPVSLKPLFGIK